MAEEGQPVVRDRDPPPSWNGEKPETTWKVFLRDLELWEAVTDLPKAKRGVKLVQALSGAAKEAVQSITVSDLIAEDGLKKVTKALSDAFAPYQETALPRAMETASMARQGPIRRASQSTSSASIRPSRCSRVRA